MTLDNQVVLSQRFGNPNYYQDYFNYVDRVNMREEFNQFHLCKLTHNPSSLDKYEELRQRYLKLLGQNKMIWHRTNPNYDMNVEVSRIYRHDRNEFLAFMRLKPQGFRSDRMLPQNVEMVFHVLCGRVTFTCKGRQKIMTIGHYINCPPGSIYSIRCGNEDQSAYLIFRITEKSTSSTTS